MLVKIRNTIRNKVIILRTHMLRYRGVAIAVTSRVSFSAKIDPVSPYLIRIGDYTQIASGAIILSHDYCRGIKKPVLIGDQTFIGVNVVVLPGVSIGNNVIIGAGSVVTKDIPSNSVAVGNPCVVIKREVMTGNFGQIK